MLWWLHESILKMSHTHTFLYVIHSKTPSEQVLFRGCCKSCFDTFTYQPLFPLSTTRIASLLSGGVSPTKNGRNGTLRYATAPNWDSTALFHETQIQLSGVEFHFCPSCRLRSENGWFDPEISPARPEKRLATSVSCKWIIASGLRFESKPQLNAISHLKYSFGINADGLLLIG